jgi:flagellar export protein FliJ
VQPVETGVAAIDGMLTCGKGQRMGIFAGSGVGKSTLMGNIARSRAGQVNVIALIGERGREVGEFVAEALGPEGLQKSVVVACTSDAAPMLRLKAPLTAVTIAEAFRAQGGDVLFMMDSVTRYAMAVREVGLAAGEPPTLRGYPPSLFASLPRLVERLGSDANGTITGLFTVLVDGDDMNEPVADALRGYLDGHIVLSRRIAERGKYPAIDVLASISRLMPKVTSADHRRRAQRVRELLAHYEENRDLVRSARTAAAPTRCSTRRSPRSARSTTCCTTAANPGRSRRPCRCCSRSPATDGAIGDLGSGNAGGMADRPTMRRFRFRLQPLVRLRTQLERQSRRDLATAMTAVNQLEQQVAAAAAGVQECAAQSADTGAIGQFARALELGLRRHEWRLQGELQQASKRLETVRGAYVQKARDLNALKNLREQRRDEWRRAAQQAEQAELDALASMLRANASLQRGEASPGGAS